MVEEFHMEQGREMVHVEPIALKKTSTRQS